MTQDIIVYHTSLPCFSLSPLIRSFPCLHPCLSLPTCPSLCPHCMPVCLLLWQLHLSPDLHPLCMALFISLYQQHCVALTDNTLCACGFINAYIHAIAFIIRETWRVDVCLWRHNCIVSTYRPGVWACVSSVGNHLSAFLSRSHYGKCEYTHVGY